MVTEGHVAIVTKFGRQRGARAQLKLADAFERKLLHGVMGIQRPHKPQALLHGCNTMQAHRSQAATPRTAGCNPAHRRLRPMRPSTRLSQPRTEYTGAMLYMMPLGRGVSKPKANWAGK